MPLEFGLLWPFRNPEFARVPWPELYRTHLDLIVESEVLGYDEAWLTEHHFVDDGYLPSVFPVGGAIAGRTSRIRIGTYLILLPMHNPVEVAESAAVLDQLSGGRFDLGVGMGYRRAEFESQGLSLRGRSRRMEESLAVLRRLLSGETVTFDGEHVKLENLQIMPPPVQQPHPPIWIGAIAPPAIERVGRMGFNYLTGGKAELVTAWDESLRANGRDRQAYRAAGQLQVYVAPTREEAWEIAARGVHYAASCYLRWFAKESDDSDWEHTMSSIPPVEEVIRTRRFDFFGEQALIGTPQDVIPEIEEYVTRSGVDHLICNIVLPGLTPEQIRAGMTLFAGEVVPHFR